jgi:hypothetical protein
MPLSKNALPTSASFPNGPDPAFLRQKCINLNGAFFFQSSSYNARMHLLDLNGTWTFDTPDGSHPSRKGTVPGCVHTDLLQHGVIADPWYRDQEKDIHWVAHQNWRYTRVFHASAAQCNARTALLCFEGLDTFGWDWGLMAPTAGIWLPVYLLSGDRVLLDARITQTHSAEAVSLTLEPEWTEPGPWTVTLEHAGKTVITRTYEAAEISAVLRIPEPELWWPNGMGDQPLYTVRIALENGGEIQKTVGLRTLELIREPDEFGRRKTSPCAGIGICWSLPFSGKTDRRFPATSPVSPNQNTGSFSLRTSLQPGRMTENTPRWNWPQTSAPPGHGLRLKIPTPASVTTSSTLSPATRFASPLKALPSPRQTLSLKI